MRKVLVKFLLGILLGILLTSGCAQAQYLGSVSPATVQQTLAPVGTACTGAAQDFAVQNLGQGNHYASITSTATSASAAIIGIDTAGTQHQISDSALFFVSGDLAGSGYFPIVKVRMTCLPITATFSITYSGGSSISHINSGAFQISQINKNLFGATSAAVNQSTFIQPPPFGNSRGRINFKYTTAATTAGSTLAVTCDNAFATRVFTYALADVNTLQTFEVPASSCAFLAIAYTSGSANVNTFSLYYMFLSPGTQGSPPTGNTLAAAINDFPVLSEKGARWSVLHTPAVDVQATASKAAGAVGVRHVADCVSYSLGAIAAPAATVLTLNLRNGATGAGTIIWSKTLPVPATAALHADGNFCGLNLIGTAATAMTLEFAAGLTSEYQSVALTGYDVQ